MKWYNYLACFFAGVFLTNVIPHFIHGISGDNFPSPFANPPGKGPSSPLVNIAWAMINLVIGYFLYKAGKVQSNRLSVFIFFAGIVFISVMCAVSFTDKLAM